MELEQILSNKELNNLSLTQKLAFFDRMQIIYFLGYVAEVFGASFALLRFYSNQFNVNFRFESLCMGIGCFIQWVAVPMLLSHIKGFNMLITITETVTPRILISMINFIPITLAFIYLGMALFPASIRFESITMGVVSLFTLMTGDSVLDMGWDLANNSNPRIIGSIYIIV